MNEIIVSSFYSSRLKEPFAIYFVYTKDEGNFVVKGMSHKVEEYIKSRWWGKCFCRYTFWKDGVCRGGWQAFGIKIFIRRFRLDRVNNYPYRRSYNKDWRKYQITIYKLIPEKTPVGINREWALKNKLPPSIQKPRPQYIEKSIVVKRIPHRWIDLFNEAYVIPQSDIMTKRKVDLLEL